jgi:ethanolamine utilization protein EutN
LIIGKVIGTVVSTRKNTSLIGNKLLIIDPLELFKGQGTLVAIDTVGAGNGEIVLVALGSAARMGCGMEDSPVDAAIVGIIDDEKDIRKVTDSL